MKLFPLKRSIIDLMKLELDEAQRDLLKAQTGLEYATAMVSYQQKRVARLAEQLSNHGVRNGRD